MLSSLLVALALVVSAVVAERLRVLCLRAPLSVPLLNAVVNALRAGDRDAVQAIVEARPESHAARLIAAARAVADGETVDDTLAELQSEAVARLVLLRTLATLASTLGLMTGILSLVHGFSPEEAGLLALEAGLPERVALAHALRGMAAGVAISAVCFFALGRLRPLARQLIAQNKRVAALLADTIS